MKTVFTTGDVAKICQVAARTASKWIDSGLLQGYRIPCSKARRVPRSALVEFIKKHNMPLDVLISMDRSENIPSEEQTA